MVKLICAIVGEGSVFPVDIDTSQLVGDLKKAIKAEKPNKIQCDADELQLFLAKKDEGRGPWLTQLEALQGVSDTRGYTHLPVPGAKLRAVGLAGRQVSLGEVSDEDGAAGKGPVHVLVVVPKQVHPQEGLSLVSGSIENALNTKGIRCRVYYLAASNLGYYDPDLRAGESDKALWYDGATLRIHVLFKEERDALVFENELQNEGITQASSLDGHTVLTNVAPISRELSELRRILTWHYVPEDTDSPQVTMSSLSTNTSIVDVVTDEFKYQRIESEEWFGTVGKAQSCHLMSREHCRRYASYHKYDNDQSNRLALTSDMHDWYDGRSFAVPVMNISVESVSEGPVVGSRYKVNLIVRALNAGYARLISLHLKEGFVASEDGLEMRTSVYVLNAKVFCECMEWKRKEIDKQWKSYYDMVPAVD